MRASSLAVSVAGVCALGAMVLRIGGYLPARASSDLPPIHRGAPVTEGLNYPYHGAQFDQFLTDSFSDSSGIKSSEFYAWMESAYRSSGNPFPGKESLTLEEVLATEKDSLAAISDPAQKSQSECELAAWLHRPIKKSIP